MLDIRKGLGDASVSANSSVFFIILAYLKLLAEELGSEGVFASFGSAVHHSTHSCFIKLCLFQKHECANIELFFHTLKIFSKKMFHFINNV
jgi:hypothetical protein